MKILLIILLTFSTALFAQNSNLRKQMDDFQTKHKKAYLYCTGTNYESCHPIKEIKFEFDDSMKNTPYMVNNSYTNSILTIKLNPSITEITLQHELLSLSSKLLDPL